MPTLYYTIYHTILEYTILSHTILYCKGCSCGLVGPSSWSAWLPGSWSLKEPEALKPFCSPTAGVAVRVEASLETPPAVEQPPSTPKLPITVLKDEIDPEPYI